MDENPYKAPQSNLDKPAEPGDEDDVERMTGIPHHEYDPTGLLFAAAARRSGLDIEALRFVFDAKINAWDLSQDTPEGRLHGPRLCQAVVRYAEELYGADGLRALSDWGLVSGQDVGRVVAALVKNGLIEPPAADGSEDFAAVGPLRQLGHTA